jgi:hypothetical protein
VLRNYQLSDIDHSPAELIQAAGEILRSEFYKRTNFIWTREQFPEHWTGLLLHHFTVKIIEAYDFH